ncbi:MAG: hypothetical protein QXT73_02795 [Candidatus Methanomethylicaceae archaeon]
MTVFLLLMALILQRPICQRLPLLAGLAENIDSGCYGPPSALEAVGVTSSHVVILLTGTAKGV